jgi:hypothetical protein
MTLLVSAAIAAPVIAPADGLNLDPAQQARAVRHARPLPQQRTRLPMPAAAGLVPLREPHPSCVAASSRELQPAADSAVGWLPRADNAQADHTTPTGDYIVLRLV